MLPYRLYHFWRLALLPSLLINAETLLRVPQGKEERVKVGGRLMVRTRAVRREPMKSLRLVLARAATQWMWLAQPPIGRVLTEALGYHYGSRFIRLA
jgi:hypothetical protein